MKLSERLPEPSAGWVRWWSRTWPRPSGLFFDPGRFSIGHSSSSPATGEEPTSIDAWDDVDDVVYVPAASSRGWREDLVGMASARGVPLTVEVRPGDDVGGLLAAPTSILPLWVDFEALVGDCERLRAAPAGCAVLLAWLPAFTAPEERWRLLVEAVADSSAETLVIAAPELAPEAKRALAERCDTEAQYSQLFHGAVVAEGAEGLRALRRAAAESGLGIVPERPMPQAPERLRRNRLLSAALTTAAEVALDAAQELYRAARILEREKIDLWAIASEGNLGVVDWLGSEGRDVVQEVVASGPSFALGPFARRLVLGR